MEDGGFDVLVTQGLTTIKSWDYLLRASKDMKMVATYPQLWKHVLLRLWRLKLLQGEEVLINTLINTLKAVSFSKNTKGEEKSIAGRKENIKERRETD